MKYFKFLSWAFFALLLITACNSDDEGTIPPVVTEPVFDFSEGFFVTNEGSFGGSGSLTFVKNDFSEKIDAAFASVNETRDIGSFVQSVFFDEERMYIISNGSNLINVVNRNTLEFIALIDSGLEVPRYGVVHNGKAYVTNLASFGSPTDDFIAVIDLSTFQVESQIAINAIADQIAVVNEKLVVQNSAFSDGNSLRLVNPATAQVEAVAEVGNGLDSFAIRENFIYTLSSEAFSVLDAVSLSLVSSIEFQEDTHFSNLQLDGNQLYYTSGNEIFTASLEAIAFTEAPLFSYSTTSASGVFYGFKVLDNKIYIADGGDFASNGTMYVYSLNGEILYTAETGLGPNGFYFN